MHALEPLGYEPALHQQIICNALQELVDGPPGGRLMIFAPPGSAKSTYVSRLFVPWVFSRYPNWSIIGASHGAMFAEENSQYAISYLKEYGDFLDVTLKTENVQRWRTKAPLTVDKRRAGKGGDYLAAGVAVGIAGFRADLAIIDDPIRGRKQANSEADRKTIWNWFNGDLARRLKPGARVVLMHTRWHEDDLAGRLLKTQPDRWKVLSLPALCVDPAKDPLGRALDAPMWANDPYGYGESLTAIRDELMANGAALDWSALYQQDPKAQDGAFFKVDKLNYIEEADIPHGTTWVRAWDLAASKDVGTIGAAYTAGVKIGRTPNNKFIIGHCRRERLDPEKVEELLKDVAREDRFSHKMQTIRIGIPQDPGQAGKFQVAYLTSVLAGLAVESSPETGDKTTRAEPFAAQLNVGNVSLLRGGWNEAYKEELRSFPVGATKDQVDATSRGFSMVFQGGAALWAALGAKR